MSFHNLNKTHFRPLSRNSFRFTVWRIEPRKMFIFNSKASVFTAVHVIIYHITCLMKSRYEKATGVNSFLSSTPPPTRTPMHAAFGRLNRLTDRRCVFARTDVPVYLQKEAVHCTVLLLPDEHREALFTLLDFLSRVSSRSDVNQMSASNLAVCLAPSLFHLGGPSSHGAASSTPPSPVTVVHHRSSSVSPRRNHQSPSAIGLPDSKQLGQNKAAHDCLLFLIKNYHQLFVVRTPSFIIYPSLRAFYRGTRRAKCSIDINSVFPRRGG